MKRTLSLLLLYASALNAMETSISNPDADDSYKELKIDVSFSNSAITAPQTILARYALDGAPLPTNNGPLSVSPAFKPGSSAKVELYSVHLPVAESVVLACTISNPDVSKFWPLSHLFPTQWKWTFHDLKAGETDQLIVCSDPKIIMTVAAYIETKKKE